MRIPIVLNQNKHLPTKNSIYIGRGSPFGNPFSIGTDGTREEVIEKYQKHIQETPGFIERVKKELKGKDLVCFCKPLPCHGDILLKIANERDENERTF